MLNNFRAKGKRSRAKLKILQLELWATNDYKSPIFFPQHSANLGDESKANIYTLADFWIERDNFGCLCGFTVKQTIFMFEQAF